MDTMDSYKVDLKSMQDDAVSHRWILDDNFFSAVNGAEISKGHLDVTLEVMRKPERYELDFQLDGTVKVQCDRCLELMDFPIHTEKSLTVKMGEEFEDDGGDVITIPEDSGVVDTAWYMYEMAALEIPIRHVHPEGECNKEVMRHLNGQDSEEHVDPRWAALAKLKNNNK